MKDKVYEMDDDYKQAVADLLENIKIRDRLAEFVKIAPPEKLRESQELLADMDKQIEKCEASLAKEYKAYQTKCRKEEELDDVMEDVAEKMQMFYVLIKHRMPEKIPELEAAIFDNCTPEEIQNFMDGVAILEATRLEEIIVKAKR